ncbi:acylphosphatase, putative [Trypanosoma equiperdum]|uniref:Acylphosphatase n=4 Tax=Trypanozoon TaxID=39700 RepID=Q57ZA8_TRYB2|nr:acylphosphatase, putative [Trypanosoma brucei gambiense DAL972]XP_843797.1 acylphosphatase, putative [Trypanosoma brucei brucei TREU927]AAX80260.1 acylphosphatase, putative [Trypanosoma brucei]RHW73857.1 acylphosphatase [Trypanosoma brucei equiperdum]SCU70669.1 acylphosphatase, putative [Trypanosoma equiperdum]AAZ10238.1 acylphosphatase, putative [Trypanosoma brucei brucei TREU927]CBH09858.1 acylphosphatase, putative [Trypanosoma brucei gambiense DAL972]|eukprot:XP_011772151.1 acylphosphatase, putative [Trypanosoma brucei gambiense DAL972]
MPQTVDQVASSAQNNEGMIVRCHVFVRGRVQGVFFRKHTQKAAEEFGVRGWVRNLPDGRVELMAEGPKQQVANLVKWCNEGSPKSRVEGVDSTTEAEGIEYSFDTFEILR